MDFAPLLAEPPIGVENVAFPDLNTTPRPTRSDNPIGRSWGGLTGARLRQAMDHRLPDGRTIAQLIAEWLVKAAIRGDIRALRELLDRVEGKVPGPWSK